MFGGVIDKPYVWLQGDGAARVDSVSIMADGVRVSGLITYTIHVGDVYFFTPPSDLDNIWITGNVVSNEDNSDKACEIRVKVGGGTRSHSIVVSNNRLGGVNAGGVPINNCKLLAILGDSGVGTTVSFLNNYVENSQCIHGWTAIGASGFTDQAGTLLSDTSRSVIISTGNTFYCNIIPGIQEQGENFSCMDFEHAFGHFYSVRDRCTIRRLDSGPSHHTYALLQTDAPYIPTLPRSIDVIEPTLEVDLPANHWPGDSIGYAYLDSHYLNFTIDSPHYHEYSLGTGWTNLDKYFIRIDGYRQPPPNGADTFVKWNAVTESPSPDFSFTSGANLSSVTMSPSTHLLPEAFGQGLKITGANLSSSCTRSALRYDTGGASKELCICDPDGAWNCLTLGPRID